MSYRRDERIGVGSVWRRSAGRRGSVADGLFVVTFLVAVEVGEAGEELLDRARGELPVVDDRETAAVGERGKAQAAQLWVVEYLQRSPDQER